MRRPSGRVGPGRVDSRATSLSRTTMLTSGRPGCHVGVRRAQLIGNVGPRSFATMHEQARTGRRVCGSHHTRSLVRRGSGRPLERAIFDLSFSLESRYRPFELVAPSFVAVSEQPTGPGLHLADASPQAPFCTVELQVEDATDPVLAGLATTSGEHVLGVYDPVARLVSIEVRRSGRTRVLRRRKVRLPATFGFAFVVCENQVTLLADTGDGWAPLLTERRKVAAAVDLRQAETLAAHRYAWGTRADQRSVAGPRADATTGLTAVRAGLFGMAGVRDQHLVQHADGRPYVKDGKAYLTGTCAGLGFFQQAHWGVFTLDLQQPTRLELVAQLFSRRGGMVLGDHAGQVVRSPEDDAWIVATSSWGDFDFDGVHVRHTVTSDDVLSGVHLLATEPTPLPTTDSSWDPGLTRIDGRWHVSFVESPSQQPFDFHPALAAGPARADWTEKLEMVGARTELHQCEGPVLARVDGEWWFLASDGHHRHYPVFDLDVRRVGRLDAPYGTNIPHPQLVPLEDGSFLVVTFDGTQYAERVMGYGGHGDVLIMRSNER